METASNDINQIRLLRGTLEPDGVHSSARLIKGLARGELLRVRRGVYAQAEDWLGAPPWTRYQIALAAVAITKAPIFCRESALVLHGLPLLRYPKSICARTADRGTAKTLRPPDLTGSVALADFRRNYVRTHPDSPPPPPQAFTNIPTRLLEPACPTGIPRTELRRLVGDSQFQIPEARLASDALARLPGPSPGYRADPLGLAAVDTASRLPFTDAVVILDALKARHSTEVTPWLAYLRTQRQRRIWKHAWGFADARSESALESESRAVLHQINSPSPVLQHLVRTPIGDFRLDFAWEKERIAGEVDGKSKYFDRQLMNGMSAAEVHYQEKRRREALEAEGWLVVRWGKAELRNPQLLINRLSRAGLRPVT